MSTVGLEARGDVITVQIVDLIASRLDAFEERPAVDLAPLPDAG